MSKNSLPVIAGVEITTDTQGRFNLNSLHKASGGQDSKRPKTWLDTKQAQELVEELRQNSALGQEVIKVQKGGTTPGTFAHELLAVSYAGWISPSFQLQVNQTFIDYRTGKIGRIKPLVDNGLPEYRKAKAQQLSAQAFKTTVESMEHLFNLMPHLSDVSRQCAAAHIVNPLLGRGAIPLPTVNAHYLSAREVGELLGVSAHHIGRTANEHQLKTGAYGKVFIDKSPYSSKQVESFRYNAEGIKALRELIHGKAVS